MKRFIYIPLIVIIDILSVSAQESNSGAIFYQQLSWSPDGKYLSATAMTDYNSKTDDYQSGIYLIKADGSNPQKITASEKKAYYSSWSKDGKRVALSMDVENSKDSDIFTINRDGTGLVQLTRNAG